MRAMASTSADIVPRQIWVDPTPTSGSLPHSCTPFRLSSGGQINIGQGTIITLTQDAAFQPACDSTLVPPPIDPIQPGVDLSVLDAQDPWYSSTNPQIYAISAVTIVSYMLVIILFITPRTFFVGGAGGGGGFLGQAGAISGTYGNNPVIGIGGRPWLQKIAASTVAISMTIVTADTFTWAHRQYDAGYQDATELTSEVIGGLEVRIVRVISETFLWLAQAQTLIRLFPRHKEKLLIKWLAFALIVLELIFSCLNHFLVKSIHSKKFVSAVPAMNYLFALTLNLCYGGFIIYFALQKRRFAFYHEHMRNMPLVALLSLTAVLIPVVFFVLDLSSPNVSGWGSYVRWVGSAAASVVVWEWVERIEALERDEKKGGILGREIFDGDEVLDATAGSDVSWPSSHRKYDKRASCDSGFGFGLSTGWGNVATKARRLGRKRHLNDPRSQSQHDSKDYPLQRLRGRHNNKENHSTNHLSHPDIPSAVASPLSGGDRASTGSPIYIVRNYSVNEAPPSTQGDTDHNHLTPQRPHQHVDKWPESDQEDQAVGTTPTWTGLEALMRGVQRIPNPFRRARETPPPEVARALAERSQESDTIHGQSSEHPSLLERLYMKRASKPNGPSRPVIVVPAPPRRRTSWNESLYEREELGDGTGDSIQHSQTASDGIAGDRDADLPPDAVLNAMSTSTPSGTVPDQERWHTR